MTPAPPVLESPTPLDINALKSIKLNRANEMVVCEIGGEKFWTTMGYLRGFVFGKKNYIYLNKYHSEEERKRYKAERAAADSHNVTTTTKNHGGG